ncbi:MAG: hypothetical protein GY765_24975 [bacterium]|nr:hypothetical protein [bacterium]
MRRKIIYLPLLICFVLGCYMGTFSPDLLARSGPEKEVKKPNGDKKDGKSKKKNKDNPPGLFKSHEILELTLTRDAKAVGKDVKEKRSFHAATLSYKDHKQHEVILNVKVKTRGKTRRNPKLCDSPPLTVKFDKKETVGTIFRKQGKLKLVVPCKRKISAFDHYLMKEYFAYRLYNILTKKSFRVRLANITFVDSEGKSKTYRKYAFFIESDKKMAKRNKCKKDKSGRLHWKMKDGTAQVVLSVFQFMIGNTDWSLPGRHNVKIIRDEKVKDLFYAVPYDFDMSGFVNAHYAYPNEKLRKQIPDVRVRLYRGFCRPLEEYAPVLAIFKEKKKDVYDFFESCTLLKGKHKKSVISYFDSFYKILENPKQIKKHFMDNCKELRK